MSLDSLDDWKTSFAAGVKGVKDDSWKDNLPDWYESVLNSPKLSLPGLEIASPPLPFTFGKAAFKAIFETMTKTSNGPVVVADAWEAGILASVVEVKAGDSIGAPSPTTLWSDVTTSVIDPASIALGKAKILELASAPTVKDATKSHAPIRFYEATLLLTVTTTGLDSTPGPAGPLPLVDAGRAVG